MGARWANRRGQWRSALSVSPPDDAQQRLDHTTAGSGRAEVADAPTTGRPTQPAPGRAGVEASRPCAHRSATAMKPGRRRALLSATRLLTGYPAYPDTRP